jgi:hypothetical protein
LLHLCQPCSLTDGLNTSLTDCRTDIWQRAFFSAATDELSRFSRNKKKKKQMNSVAAVLSCWAPSMQTTLL